jgi:NADPH:quinone reductase-like Zn-dependent oxidoreductase
MLQLLKRRKCHITAVCSGANAEAVTRLGADEAVDYTVKPFGQQLAEADKKFSVVFDFIGGREAQSMCEPLMEKGGMYVSAVGDRQYVGDRKLSCGEWSGSAFRLLGFMCCGCGMNYKYTMSGAYPPLTAEIWKSTVIEAGARAAVVQEVPFAEAPIRAALAKVSSHHPGGGRVVINLERSA